MGGELPRQKNHRQEEVNQNFGHQRKGNKGTSRRKVFLGVTSKGKKGRLESRTTDLAARPGPQGTMCFRAGEGVSHLNKNPLK